MSTFIYDKGKFKEFLVNECVDENYTKFTKLTHGITLYYPIFDEYVCLGSIHAPKYEYTYEWVNDIETIKITYINVDETSKYDIEFRLYNRNIEFNWYDRNISITTKSKMLKDLGVDHFNSFVASGEYLIKTWLYRDIVRKWREKHPSEGIISNVLKSLFG